MPTSTRPYLVLYVNSLIAAYLGEPVDYTVIGLLRAENLQATFQAMQQPQGDWTLRPGNIRLVSAATPVRSGSVNDLLITAEGEIWRVDAQAYTRLDELPGTVSLSQAAQNTLNAARQGRVGPHISFTRGVQA